MKRPAPVDWPRLLGDLAYLLGDELPGTTAREQEPLGTLAEFLAVPRSTLRGWLDGAEPRHNDSEALLRWAGLAGKAPVFAPLLSAGGETDKAGRAALIAGGPRSRVLLVGPFWAGVAASQWARFSQPLFRTDSVPPPAAKEKGPAIPRKPFIFQTLLVGGAGFEPATPAV